MTTAVPLHFDTAVELLRTKLVPPQPYGSLVVRDELHRRLDAALVHKLTLVAAPAGWGKTTLVSTWLSSRMGQFRNAWVSLDDGDNDPVRYWRHVFTALHSFAPHAAEQALDHLNATPQLSCEAALAAWNNAVGDRPEHGVLVLEDYHVITSPQIHAGMSFLLDHLAPMLHVVIIGRSDPPFPLGRMRAHTALLELRAPDLRFTLAEIQQFVDQTTPCVFSPELVMRLDARTEGWAVGLRLLMIALGKHPNQQSIEEMLSTDVQHRHIREYLVGDVFAVLPVELQHFLVETSGLRRLNASLCDAVRGSVDSAHILAQLEHRNLFLVPLDPERHWFRFHALFAETVRREAHERCTDEALEGFARRASRWYETHALFEEAIEAALDAHAYEDAARLIEHLCTAKQPYFEHHSARRWIEHLPSNLLAVRPALCLLHAQAILFTSDRRNASTRALVEAPLRMAEQHCEEASDDELLGAVFSLRAFMLYWQGEHAAMAQYARRALALLPQHDVHWRCMSLMMTALDECARGRLRTARQLTLDARACSVRSGNQHSLYAATLKLGDITAEQGALGEAAALYGEVLEALGSDASGEQLAKRGLALAGLAALAYEQNDCDRAERLATEGISIGQQLHNEDVIVKASLVLLRIRRAQGATAEAHQQFRSLVARIKQPANLRAVELVRARFALMDGNLAAVLRWQMAYENDSVTVSQPTHLQEMLVGARLLMAGDTKGARTMLERCRAEAHAQGRGYIELETMVLAALCDERDGALAQAQRTLIAALESAQFEGYQRLFLDEGAALLPLLRHVIEVLGLSSLRRYAQQLLESLGGLLSHDAPICPAEPLTPQEQRVLHLLMAGHSNVEMAQMFVVSVNTIKTQVKSIYRKLNVSNRLQAANVARQLPTG